MAELESRITLTGHQSVTLRHMAFIMDASWPCGDVDLICRLSEEIARLKSPTVCLAGCR